MTRYFAPKRAAPATIRQATSRPGRRGGRRRHAGAQARREPRETAFWYASDGQGNVRLMGTQPQRESGYLEARVQLSVPPARRRTGTPLSQVTVDSGLSTGFEPIAVDPRENVAYGFEDNGDFQALFKMALDGSGTKTLVLGRDDADIDGLLRIGRSQRIVGASYATERREVEYFDPELGAWPRRSAARSAGASRISIVDSTADESKLLVFAGSDTDPGAYYLYDKATKQLAQLLPARPELAGVALGEMRAVQYPAADGTMVPAYLTFRRAATARTCPRSSCRTAGRARATNGASTGCRSTSSATRLRGAAAQLPRLGGLRHAWFQKNGFQSWETAIGDVNAAGRWLRRPGHRRARQAGDLRLVVRRLRGAAVAGARSRPVQGGRRGRAGDRSRAPARGFARLAATSRDRQLHRQRPARRGRLARAARRRVPGAGAAVPRRYRHQRRRRRVAADAATG